jgi:multidrug efflux system outer membrane protein
MNYKLCMTALLALALSGCAWLSPSYQRPELDLPESTTSSENRDQRTQERLIGWWQEYHDPVLHRLIDRALAQSDDIALAAARLKQARSMYDYSFSNQFPLLSITGVGTRSDLNFKDSNLLPDKPANLSFIGGMLSYEVDLWGKLASANQAAKASFLAASYNQDAVRLSVASATAQLYFNILALNADIKITKDTIVSRENSYKLYKVQYEYELANGLVLRQSKAELDSTRAQLPPLLEQKDKAESSLAVLLGSSPREIMAAGITPGKELDAMPVPPFSPAELPSNLLQRRPDISAAEQALIASNFNIGVARAAFFPTISLSSLYGVSSMDIQNLYNGSGPAWQLGASLAGPVIDFGRTASGVELAKARNQEQLAVYKNSVRTAFKEVKDALSAQEHSRDEEQALADEETEVKEALRLANLRYAAGLSSYIEVLDAERNLYSVQIALVAAKLKRLNASANLYKALGGGKQDDLMHTARWDEQKVSEARHAN